MELIIPIAIMVCFVFLMRFLGAWAFRINEVINELKEINNKLNKLNQLNK